jgi:hypothetical protein
MMTLLPIDMVTTKNPERETWRYLRLFSKESYVAKLVKEKTATDQIVSCVRQAGEIYSLSESTSLLTKPVLLYYGMQRLAKALIFLRNPNIDPNDLKKHGLTGAGISDKIDRFLHNKVRTTKKGIFPEFSRWTTKNNVLLEATVYEEGGYHHPRYYIHEFDVSDFLNASEFKVYDLFSLIPEIGDLFHHFEMKNNLLIFCGVSLRQHPNGKSDTLLSVEKKLDLDSLKTRFPIIGKFNSFRENPNKFTLQTRSKDTIEIPSPLVQSQTRHTWLIASTESSGKISDLNVHFILMFMLCHIARYKAPLLREIMEGRQKSEYCALIERFIEVSESKFPKLILDQLVGRYFMFVEG